MTEPPSAGPTFDGFGPFEAGIAPADRLARCHHLRDAVPYHQARVRNWLSLAAIDALALPGALTRLNEMPTLDRRHALARYGARL